MPKSRSILVVDDEEMARELFSQTLQRGGYEEVVACGDSREVMNLLAQGDFQVLLMDLQMPFITGQQLLPQIVAAYPALPVVVITGSTDLETAVKCMKAGARDYLVKPISPSRLLATINTLSDYRDLQRENERLRQSLTRVDLDHPEAFHALVTRNARMMQLFRYIEAIATTSKPVLITGETGVGKDLFAQTIHRLSGRTGQYVAINVAGLDDHLFSDALFGHVKGAFTGAATPRAGLVEQAAGGTLFLDEVGDLSTLSQTRLLRLLQEGDFYPLGSDKPRRAKVRVLAATNRNLGVLQQEGKFRSDLYYRLQVHQVHIPPLRERRDDIPLLLEHFLRKAGQELGREAPGYPDELVALLNSHSFPGNVRELESLVFEAMSKHRSHLLSLHSFHQRLPAGILTQPGSDSRTDGLYSHLEQLPTLRQATEQLVSEAVRRAGGRQTLAARLLGISQPALSKRLKGGH